MHSGHTGWHDSCLSWLLFITDIDIDDGRKFGTQFTHLMTLLAARKYSIAFLCHFYFFYFSLFCRLHSKVIWRNYMFGNEPNLQVHVQNWGIFPLKLGPKLPFWMVSWQLRDLITNTFGIKHDVDNVANFGLQPLKCRPILPALRKFCILLLRQYSMKREQRIQNNSLVDHTKSRIRNRTGDLKW